MFFKRLFYKLWYWEYWPIYMFYVPNLGFALYHALKAKSCTFYTAANPIIENSGIGAESKYKVQQLLPSRYQPKTVFHLANSCVKETLEQLNNKTINFPVIVKPDIGFRGLLVKKIASIQELINYLEKYPINFLVQEFLNYKNECGVFFIRYPDEKKGIITSITLKELPKICGNGVDSLKKLIKKDRRLFLYAEQLEKLADVNQIPKKGEIVVLSSIGNHSKGTQFINGNHLIDNKLKTIFTELSHQIKDWNYGRLDIKYDSWEKLLNGDFKIVELNGVLSEPTHIYDSKKISYWGALKTIRNHWKHLYNISVYNHKAKDTPYTSASLFIKKVKNLRSYVKEIKQSV